MKRVREEVRLAYKAGREFQLSKEDCFLMAIHGLSRKEVEGEEDPLGEELLPWQSGRLALNTRDDVIGLMYLALEIQMQNRSIKRWLFALFAAVVWLIWRL